MIYRMSYCVTLIETSLMNMKTFLLTLVIVFVGISSSSMAQTLGEALSQAYASNPLLQAERAGIRAVDEDLVQARAARLPSLQTDASIGAVYTEQTSPFFSANQTYYPRSLSLSGNQTLYAGGSIRGNIDLARVNIDIARNNLRSVEQQVLFDALSAYLGVQRNVEVVRIRAKNVEVLAKQLQAANDRFDVGEITRTGVSQAKARLAGARSLLALARSELSASRAAYVRTIGQSPGTLDEVASPKILPEDMATAINWAEGYAPILIAAKLSELSASHGVTIAKSGLRPRLSIGARASTADNSGFIGAETDTVSSSLNFTMPLFTGGLNRSQIRKAREQESQARIGVLQARRIVHEQVSNAWFNLIAAKSVIYANEQQVAANELAFEGVEQEAAVGQRTTLDVLNAEQELLDARLALITANRDVLVAEYGLLRAAGRLNLVDLGISK
jgi:outer membrane protein